MSRHHWFGALAAAIVGAQGCAKPGPVATPVALVDLTALDLQEATGAWAPGPEAPLLPIGVWVQVGEDVAFTYVDPEQGPSAQWHSRDGVSIRRIEREPLGMVVLDTKARERLDLPDQPAWLAHYGPQPPPGTRWASWRDDPRLGGRFHPDYPDDLRVLIGDDLGGRLVHELVWVSLRSCDDVGCRGALLNQPHRVRLTRGDQIAFRYDHLVEGGLPPAATVGAQPLPALVELSRSAALQGRQQDETAWEVDTSQPMEELLPPMSQWIAVGDVLGFVYLGAIGPEVVLFDEGQVARRSVVWRTRGMRVLTESEVRELGLSPTPFTDNEGQPPPGPWGTWRFDPRLEPLLDPAYPDVLSVHLLAADAETQTASADVVRASIRSCDEEGCDAVLVAEPLRTPAFAKGDLVRFSLDNIRNGAPIVVSLSPPDR